MTDSPSETLKSAMNNKGFTVTTSGRYIFHQANVIVNPPTMGKFVMNHLNYSFRF